MGRRIILILVCSFVLAVVWCAPAIAQPIQERVWPMPAEVLDQGSFGACVGTAWDNWIESGPQPMDSPGWLALYYRATVLDDIAWNDYSPDAGTWLWAGGKAVEERGLIGTVRYSKDVTEARDWILSTGSVVVAAPWYDVEIERDGYHTESGRIRGFHAYLCYGYSEGVEKDGFLCRNSWGAGWGQGGDFRVHFHTFEYMAAHGLVDFALATKPYGLAFGSAISGAWAV